jgi:hypothetical protein
MSPFSAIATRAQVRVSRWLPLVAALAIAAPQTVNAAPRATQPAAPAPAPTLPDQVWAPMLQREVELIIRDGTVVTGTLIGHDATSVTVIGTDGVVKVQPKAAVVLLRAVPPAAAAVPAPVVVPPAYPPASAAPPVAPAPQRLPTGKGLLVSGAVLTSIGALLWATSVGLAADRTTNYEGETYPSFSPGVWAPFLVTSMFHLGAGIPMLAVGARRRRAYSEAGDRPSLSFAAVPSGRRGASASLTVRF